MPKNTQLNKTKPIYKEISLIGFLLGLIGFLAKLFFRDLPSWFSISALIIFLCCVLFLIRNWIYPMLKRTHPHVEMIAPWLIVVLLFLSVLILYNSLPKLNTVVIVKFDEAKGAIFNSWLHQPHTKHLNAVGENNTPTWRVSDEGVTGTFHFHVDPEKNASFNASVGGYITFYAQQIDRLRYDAVTFNCKVSNYDGTPDLGVRLTVDNPKATGDREIVSYEVSSLAKYSTLSAEWQSYSIPLNAFQQIRFEPPFPERIDENTINKIVFFVDNTIGDKCPRATFSISNIKFIIQ